MTVLQRLLEELAGTGTCSALKEIVSHGELNVLMSREKR
jgi:hypothetical protein